MLRRSLLILLVMALVAMGVTAYMLAKDDDTATIPLDAGTAAEERVTVYVTGAVGRDTGGRGTDRAGCRGLRRRDARRGFSENQFSYALKRRPAHHRAGRTGGGRSGSHNDDEAGWSRSYQCGG